MSRCQFLAIVDKFTLIIENDATIMTTYEKFNIRIIFKNFSFFAKFAEASINPLPRSEQDQHPMHLPPKPYGFEEGIGVFLGERDLINQSKYFSGCLKAKDRIFLINLKK